MSDSRAHAQSASSLLAEPETVSPFLHDRGTVVYNPLTGGELQKSDPAFGALSQIEKGQPGRADPAAVEHLRAMRFLIEDIEKEGRRSHLLYLSIETCTVCNHRCPFCPVSVEPRDKDVMAQDVFESVIDQAVEAGGKGLVVFLSNYNEPTVDPLFEDRVRFLFGRRLPVSILTNATGFTPERCDLFESLGRFRYIGVNLPTLRPDRYEKLHGTKDLARVLANLDAMRVRELAEETAIVVLGDEDEEHRRDVEELRARFEPKGWAVKPSKIRSRPDSRTYVPEPPAYKNLKGCELMGSRPFEHLHVTATGKAVLCCQDYFEKHVIGDVKTQTVAEILGGDTLARLRRWAYGVDQAPDDFMCRRCEFAIGS
ncbi:MAG: radical SAM/SPASM domain-containing protein [Thermoanaerobaculia bacterium]